MNITNTHVKSVCIATPAYEGMCRAGYVESLLHLVLALQREGYGIFYATTRKSSVIAQARNQCADYFLNKTNATHLLFIDADMSFRTEDVLRLLRHGDLDVAAAACPLKKFDWEQIAKIARKFPNLPASELSAHTAIYASVTTMDDGPIYMDSLDANGMLEVAEIGTGLMLIRRDVFTRLKAAHPDWLHVKAPHCGTYMFFEGGRRDGEFVGEDMDFCSEVRAVGGHIYMCPWFEIGHIGAHEFEGQMQLGYARPNQGRFE